MLLYLATISCHFLLAVLLYWHGPIGQPPTHSSFCINNTWCPLNEGLVGLQCVDVWMCGRVEVWRCGCVAVWMCGRVDVWLCGCVREEIIVCFNMKVSFVQRSSKDGCGNIDLQKPPIWVIITFLGVCLADFLSCCFSIGKESDFKLPFLT
jgi:hypothetical protein